MPEFDCFCTKDEFAHTLQEAMLEGYGVHVRRHLSEPHSVVHRDPSAVVPALEAGSAAFLLERADITRYPIGLVAVDGTGVREWALRSKEGGPVIEAYFWAPYQRENRRIVACSLFSYHSKIRRPDGIEEPAGDGVRRAFRKLIAPLRLRSRMMKGKTKSAFVTPGVDERLASGWVLAAPYGGD